MIQPPLLGVVSAANAVSARTLTCRAPAVPLDAAGVHRRTGAVFALVSPA
jgi:hypothetical protein